MKKRMRLLLPEMKQQVRNMENCKGSDCGTTSGIQVGLAEK
jgi:hypothetical protein